MSAFFPDYIAGQPVYAEIDGRPFSTVLGFVMFPDGIGWADDSALQQVPSRSPLHQLYGTVEVGDDWVRCGDTTFRSIPVDAPELAKAWNEVLASGRDIMAWQDDMEFEIRRERMLAAVS